MPRGRPSEIIASTFTFFKVRVCTKATHSLLAEEDDVTDATNRLPTELQALRQKFGVFS